MQQEPVLGSGVLATTESYEFEEEGDSLVEMRSGMRQAQARVHLRKKHPSPEMTVSALWLHSHQLTLGKKLKIFQNELRPVELSCGLSGQLSVPRSRAHHEHCLAGCSGEAIGPACRFRALCMPPRCPSLRMHPEN